MIKTNLDLPDYSNKDLTNFQMIGPLCSRSAMPDPNTVPGAYMPNRRNLSFSSAKLTNAEFLGIDFRGCDFTGADFTGASLVMCDLRGAIFSGTTLVYTSLSGSKLCGSMFEDTILFELVVNTRELKKAFLDTHESLYADYASIRAAHSRKIPKDKRCECLKGVYLPERP